MSRQAAERARVLRAPAAAIVGLAALTAPLTHANAAAAPAGSRLELVDQTFAVAPAGSFTAVFAPAPQDARGGTVEVTLHAAVDSVDGIDAAVAGATRGRIDTVTVPAAEVLDTDGGGRLTVPVSFGGEPPSDAALDAAGPGLYPVTIGVRSGGASAAATTFVELVDGSARNPISIAVLAGVADPGPWASAADTADASSAVDDAADLAATVDAPLSFHLPPALVATAAQVPPELEASSPPASDPAATGTSPGRPVPSRFDGDELRALPLTPLDPSSIAALDGGPEHFVAELVRGESALGTASPLASRNRLVWVQHTPASAGASLMLRDLGVQLVVATTPPDGLAPGDLFTVDLGPGRDPIAGVVANPLGGGLAAPQDGSAVQAAAFAMARIEVLRRDGTSALVLADAELALPDPGVTAAFARFARALPGVSVVPLSGLIAPVGRAIATDHAASITPPPAAGADLSARAAEIQSVRSRADQAATMLVEPGRAAGWDAAFDRLLASTLDDGEAAAHLAAVGAEVDAVVGAITAPTAMTFTLTGRSTELPLNITNAYDQPLRVVVRVRSPKLESKDTEVVLPAAQEYPVLVSVTARSGGTFTVQVDVLSPDRGHVAGPVFFKASVRRLTGLSQVATGGAALALASWWFSHFRRNRRRRLADVASMPPGQPALSPDAAEARGERG